MINVFLILSLCLIILFVCLYNKVGDFTDGGIFISAWFVILGSYEKLQENIPILQQVYTVGAMLIGMCLLLYITVTLERKRRKA